MTLLSKEPGTIEWISAEVRPGDSFCDVGANIGLYSLVAADRVGPRGVVYAFEPHPANFLSLLANIAANGYEERVRALSCALNDANGWFDFHYHALGAGSSISQLGRAIDDEGKAFKPVYSELKCGVTLDELVERGAIRPPDHVKIDVDGNEALVLEGMRSLLRSPRRPRSLQIEMNSGARERVLATLESAGYQLAYRHYSAAGRRAVDGGADPVSVPHNAVFKPRSEAGGRSIP